MCIPPPWTVLDWSAGSRPAHAAERHAPSDNPAAHVSNPPNPPLLGEGQAGAGAPVPFNWGGSDEKDIYQRVTDSIVAELERGVRPWLKLWNAEHAAGRITRPLRSSFCPVSGNINVLMLWAEAVEKGFAAPVWMTFKQSLELGGHVRKGEKGSLGRLARVSTCKEHLLRNGASDQSSACETIFEVSPTSVLALLGCCQSRLQREWS